MNQPLIVHMVANAHLDPVWLWPWQDGADEAAATFRSAVDRCDEYPELIYTRGEAWLYEQVRKIDPGLFRAAEELVRTGRWYIPGGVYVQPDCNLPTREGLCKQMEIGKRYFWDTFGIIPDVSYLVDSFGFPGTFPDILVECGYRAHVCARPTHADLALPAENFWWRGVGGKALPSCRLRPTYTTRQESLFDHIISCVELATPGLGHVLCFFGFGNHGGGPTKAQIEYIIENRFAIPGVELRFSTPGAYFDAIADKLDILPEVVGELEHCLPGCYSVMQDIKQSQRRTEELLSQAGQLLERFPVGEDQPLRESLELGWRDMAFTQFHDILAGTSSLGMWSSVRAMQGRAQIQAEEVIFQVSRRWCRTQIPRVNEHRILLLNPDDAPVDGLVEFSPHIEFDHWGDRWVSDPDGNPLPFQLMQPDSPIFLCNKFVMPVKVPPGGVFQAILHNSERLIEPPVSVTVTAKDGVLSNGTVAVHLATVGIARIIYRGMDLLGADGISIQVRDDLADTWLFGRDCHAGEVVASAEEAEWVIDESGPLRAVARWQTKLGESSVRWLISLDNDSPNISLKMEILNGENLRLWQLRVATPEAGSAWRAGAQGGWVERAPGTSEWPFYGWMTNGADGLALVTPDAYSGNFRENGAMEVTLLRSPKMGCSGGQSDVYFGRDQFADQGLRTFEFQLVPVNAFDGDHLTTLARQMSRPLICFSYYEGMNRLPWGNDPVKRLWTEADERAFANGRLEARPDPGAKTLSEGRLN